MPHKRHRLHNVRDQHAERNIQSDMCSVVITGDRIFVRGLKVLDAEVYSGGKWADLSDHAALAANLAFRGSGT